MRGRTCFSRRVASAGSMIWRGSANSATEGSEMASGAMIERGDGRGRRRRVRLGRHHDRHVGARQARLDHRRHRQLARHGQEQQGEAGRGEDQPPAGLARRPAPLKVRRGDAHRLDARHRVGARGADTAAGQAAQVAAEPAAWRGLRRRGVRRRLVDRRVAGGIAAGGASGGARGIEDVGHRRALSCRWPRTARC
jgi:hypothetical protein